MSTGNPSEGSPSIRVAIVEDDPFQLQLASHIVKSAEDLVLAGTFSNGKEAVEAVGSGKVEAQVVVVDLGLPDIAGAEVTRRLRALPKPPEVVVLTAHGERAMALEALEAGASGYLLKGAPADLPVAIRVAAAGGSAIAPAIARYLLDEIRVPEPSGGAQPVPLRDIGKLPDEEAEADAKRSEGATLGTSDRPALTRREREVLGLLAKGATYDDAARVLGISLGTVQSHVKRLYRKLEVSSKAEAAAEAVRRGLAWP